MFFELVFFVLISLFKPPGPSLFQV